MPAYFVIQFMNQYSNRAYLFTSDRAEEHNCHLIKFMEKLAPLPLICMNSHSLQFDWFRCNISLYFFLALELG